MLPTPRSNSTAGRWTSRRRCAGPAADRRRSDFERLGLNDALEVGAEAVWVSADPERLELVLSNLLDNAAKYTEPGGRVTVLVEATGAEVVLRVRDTGVGIAPEVLPFVFDPFVRAGIPGVRPRRGSGRRPAAGADPGGIARRPRRGVQALAVGGAAGLRSASPQRIGTRRGGSDRNPSGPDYLGRVRPRRGIRRGHRRSRVSSFI